MQIAIKKKEETESQWHCRKVRKRIKDGTIDPFLANVSADQSEGNKKYVLFLTVENEINGGKKWKRKMKK